MDNQKKTLSQQSQSDDFYSFKSETNTNNQNDQENQQDLQEYYELQKSFQNIDMEFSQAALQYYMNQQNKQDQSQQPQPQQQQQNGEDEENQNKEKCQEKQQQQNVNEEEKVDESQIWELLFSGGAFSIAFLQGYVQALIEIVGKEKLRKFKLGGVSCGAPIAVCFYSCIHSDLDMKFFYQNYIRKYYEKENRKYYGFFTSKQIIFEQSEAFYKIMKNYNIPNLNGNLHIGMTIRDGMFSLKKLIVDKFEDSVDFANCIVGTTMVPLFIGFQIFSDFRGMKTIDGGIKCPIPYKYENSKKVFINILPKITRQWPFARDIPKNCEYIDIAETSNLKFPQDYYLWDAEWADEMFYKGYLIGLDSKENLKNIFDKF